MSRALRAVFGGSARPGQEGLLKDIEARLERLEGEIKTLDKVWRHTRHLEGGVQAILRELYLEREMLPYPEKLVAQRFRLHSQNGEDGITLALLKAMGTTNCRFVEIGSGLSGGNSAFLALECGWTGLMVDAHAGHIEQVARRFPRVTAVAAWVTRETINQLLEAHGAIGEVDLFSLDLDGNDYWVWEAMTACSPRLAIVEYNSMYGPDRAVAVPYTPQFERRKFSATYYGASLAAWVRLAARKGYRLVAVEPTGVNAYLLRNDLAPFIPACDPKRAFHMLERYDVLIQHKGADVFREAAEAGLPLIDIS